MKKGSVSDYEYDYECECECECRCGCECGCEYKFERKLLVNKCPSQGQRLKR